MLRVDKLMQALIQAIPTTEDKTVAADLDVNSIEVIPFITHSTQFTQDRNSRGLYTATLSMNVFIAPAETPSSFIGELYDGIWAWDESPTAGRIGGLGAVESIDLELSALSRQTTGAQMLNKLVTQYVGSWQLTLRDLT